MRPVGGFLENSGWENNDKPKLSKLSEDKLDERQIMNYFTWQ